LEQVSVRPFTKGDIKIGEDVKLCVGIPALKAVAVKIMREFSFEQYSKSIRMRFGKTLRKECIDGIFVIGGPEKG
jgi:hypothetical protein